MYLLTPSDETFELGCTGEIAIRTPYRTNGYINDRAAESRAFVPNPSSQDRCDMLYRTGDLGFVNSRGLLVLRGRIDRQVKIRGVRVEPDEVATILTRHPAVGAAVVVSRRTGTGEVELVCYWCPREAGDPVSKPGSIELRAYLRSKLVQEMIPGRFVELAEMPLGSNGKVDLRALSEYL